MAIPTLNPSDVFGASERGLAARNVNLLRGQEQEDRRNTLAAQQQAAAQQQVINRLIAESTDPTTGEVDRARLSIGLANAGQGGAIFGAQENVDKNAAAVANIGKTRADTLAKTFETSQKNRDYYNRAMAELANRPDLSRDMVIQTGRDLAAQGVIDPKVIESGAGALPNDPAQLRRVLTEGLRTQLTPEQQVNFFAPKPTEVDLDGSVEFVDTNPNSPTYRKPVASRPKSMTPGEAARLAEERRQFAITESRAAPASAENEVARVVTAEDGTTRFFNKFGREIAPTSATGAPISVAGKPSAGFAKLRDQKLKFEKDVNFAIASLTEAIKEGGMLDRSTGSGIGRGVDLAANFLGMSTEGSTAIAELQPIADLVLKMVPRFEGPQSDRDTLSYQQAAGRLADPTLPVKDRKAAANVILTLLKSGRAKPPEMPAEGPGSAGDDVVDTSNPLLQ